MGSCSGTRCLAVFCVILVVACAALAGVFVWRETTRPKPPPEPMTFSSAVTTNYRGMFRSMEEQKSYASQFYTNFYQNRTLVNTTIDPNEYAGKFCRFECANPVRRRRRQTGLQQIYHGCCASSVQFTAPPTHVNANGVVRTLVQFEGVKQFFAIHTCDTIARCTGCICSQEQNLFAAVVVKAGVTNPEDIEDTEIDFLFINGCCKCVNV